MNKIKNKKDKRAVILRSAIIALSVVLLITSLFMFIKEWEKDYGRFQESSEVLEKDLSYNGKQYAYKENLETILLLGLDKFSNEDSGYNNDKQADFLMLFVIDNDTKQYTAIHINRDTMVDIDVLGVAGNRIDTVFFDIIEGFICICIKRFERFASVGYFCSDRYGHNSSVAHGTHLFSK